MRPLALELEGFAAFRDRTTVDLADAELFAIVGATGHGKSTLIDAICFALYGKVPRHGERDIAPVMTLGTNETKVSFTFELAGTTYVATRVLRRNPKGDGASHRALRLERLEPDGTAELLASAKAEFQAAIERLIGLDFGQFTKCVVLPQGEFAAFLHARAGERVAILSALLDLGRYDRMGVAARERAKQATGQREALVRERERVGTTTAQHVADAQHRREQLEAFRVELETAAPRDDETVAAINEARTEARRTHAAVAALTAVRVPAEMQSLAADMEQARVAAEQAASAAETAEADAATVERAQSALPDPATLHAAAEAHTERAAIEQRIAKGETELPKLRSAAEGAKQALLAAQQAVDAAQTALAGAEHRNAHATLRAGLRVGEPCPVCEQEVATLPPKLSAAEVTKATKAVASARKAFPKAEAEGERALTALTKGEATFEHLQESFDALNARVAEFPDPAVLAAQLEAVRVAQERVEAARKQASEARQAAKTAAKHLATFDTAAARAAAEKQTQRDALVSAGLTPTASDWDELAAWAEETRPDYEKRARELDDIAREKSVARDAFLDELSVRAEALEIAAPPERSIGALALTVVGARHDADATVTRLEEQLARAVEIDEEIAAVRSAEQVATTLGQLLDKRHFGQWLVDEAMQGLVAGASALLERLSAGQYALATAADGDLLVVDHANADETRSVRSLSGGETFQASLALALALADRIADLAPDGAASLESIFLDEGFGTLDPETLDIVAGTIESLGHGERVVGVVTHVAELAERMPVRFRVRKDGRTAVVTREET